jgi:hypothetical protein
MKPEERATFILGQLNYGLRTQWSQIEEIEDSLELMLREAHARADSHIPPVKRSTWDQTWNEVWQTLSAIREDAGQSWRLYEAGDSEQAPEPWKHISELDRKLDQLFDTLQAIGRESVPQGDLDPWYDSWKGHWVNIDGRLASLRAHAIATRFQLEMRKEYGLDKADSVTRQILEHLPEDATLEDAEKYAAEYRKAYQEFEDHRDHPTLRDIFRGLLLFPEDTPDDHLVRRRRVEAEAAAVGKDE